MTIEEKFAAIERTLAHYDERLERVEEQLTQTKKALPGLQAVMKELEEASIVTSHMVALQGGVTKGQAQWLEELTKAQVKTDERFRETDERFRETGERIEKLVSAIGQWLNKSKE
jgi:chromosome segregation ATPase